MSEHVERVKMENCMLFYCRGSYSHKRSPEITGDVRKAGRLTDAGRSDDRYLINGQ